MLRFSVTKVNICDPEVGTVSPGNDINEAIENLKEATGLYLGEFSFKGEKKARKALEN